MDTNTPKLLLLVDMQNGFMNTETRKVIPVAQQLVEKWQQRGWPIVCSRFINLPGGNWERLRDWHELMDEPDTALITKLEGVTEYVFKKSTYAAWSSEMNAVARSHHVHDIVIAGVDTNECVMATALAVFDDGYTPWLVHDACFSTGGSKSHAMALELLKPLLGEQQIVSASDV
jgi:nicotinamidase-related amidase